MVSVDANSLASDVFQVGDELVTLNKQPIISQADVQWVLHHAKAQESLSVQIRRGGKLLSTNLRLDRPLAIQQ